MVSPVYIQRGKPFQKPAKPSSGPAPYFVFFLGIVGYGMLILGLLIVRGGIPFGLSFEDNFMTSSLLIFFGSSLIVGAVLRNIYIKSAFFTVSQVIVLFVLFAIVVVFA